MHQCYIWATIIVQAKSSGSLGVNPFLFVEATPFHLYHYPGKAGRGGATL